MPSAAVPPSKMLGRLLRNRRRSLRLSLAEISRRLAASGFPIPHSTLVRIEQGKLDAGVRRLHQLLRLYEIPPGVVADLVALEDLGQAETFEGDADTLYDRAVAAWRAGDFPRGIAYFLTLRDRIREEEAGKERLHRASLGLATAARDLGKLRLAKMILEDLMLDGPDPTTAVKAMILKASVWRELGSLDIAFALVRQARSILPRGDRELAAYAAHQEARLFLDAGRPKEAREALARALRSYRGGADAYGEARAKLLGVRILAASRCLEDGLREAGRVIEAAERRGFGRLAVIGRIERGRLLLEVGRVDESVRVLREAASAAIVQGDQEARFRAHYHLWKAHLSAGEGDQARAERNTAYALIRFADDTSEEAKDVRSSLASGESHVA